MKKMIRVPSLSKKGESIGDIYIRESSVLYMRSWRNPDGKDKSVVYLIGGKDVIVDLPIEELVQFMYLGERAEEEER
tara:strand:- start:2926 stop:3156 length:231 start_codon:yes stop_codon:yes gene_type:complete